MGKCIIKHNYTEKYSLQGILFNFWNKVIQKVKNLVQVPKRLMNYFFYYLDLSKVTYENLLSTHKGTLLNSR